MYCCAHRTAWRGMGYGIDLTASLQVLMEAGTRDPPSPSPPPPNEAVGVVKSVLQVRPRTVRAYRDGHMLAEANQNACLKARDGTYAQGRKREAHSVQRSRVASSAPRPNSSG